MLICRYPEVSVYSWACSTKSNKKKEEFINYPKAMWFQVNFNLIVSSFCRKKITKNKQQAAYYVYLCF